MPKNVTNENNSTEIWRIYANLAQKSQISTNSNKFETCKIFLLNCIANLLKKCNSHRYLQFFAFFTIFAFNWMIQSNLQSKKIPLDDNYLCRSKIDRLLYMVSVRCICRQCVLTSHSNDWRIISQRWWYDDFNDQNLQHIGKSSECLLEASSFLGHWNERYHL